MDADGSDLHSIKRPHSMCFLHHLFTILPEAKIIVFWMRCWRFLMWICVGNSFDLVIGVVDFCISCRKQFHGPVKTVYQRMIEAQRHSKMLSGTSLRGIRYVLKRRLMQLFSSHKAIRSQTLSKEMQVGFICINTAYLMK